MSIASVVYCEGIDIEPIIKYNCFMSIFVKVVSKYGKLCK